MPRTWCCLSSLATVVLGRRRSCFGMGALLLNQCVADACFSCCSSNNAISRFTQKCSYLVSNMIPYFIDHFVCDDTTTIRKGSKTIRWLVIVKINVPNIDWLDSLSKYFLRRQHLFHMYWIPSSTRTTSMMSPFLRLILLCNSAGMLTWNFDLTVTKFMILRYKSCWKIVILYKMFAKYSMSLLWNKFNINSWPNRKWISYPKS